MRKDYLLSRSAAGNLSLNLSEQLENELYVQGRGFAVKEADMEEKNPRLSIGIPVYNGQDFLPSALDSLLAQTFQEFEVVISDNASTDRTAEICRAYAAREPRIRYYVNEKNIGLAGNHNRLIGLAHGKYFMFHAHDDQSAPEYLTRCLEVLNQNPEVVLCFAKTVDIDEHGTLIGRDNDHRQREIPTETLDLNAKEPHVRFRDIIQLDHQCEPDYGIMRLDILRKTLMHGNYADGDRVMLAEMALHGPFHMIREPLFFHREHTGRSLEVYPNRQARNVLMDPTMAGKILFPYWKEFGELWTCIRRVPLDAREKFRCRVELLKWLINYRNRLTSDLTIGARMFLKKVLPSPVRQMIKRLLGRAQSQT